MMLDQIKNEGAIFEVGELCCMKCNLNQTVLTCEIYPERKPDTILTGKDICDSFEQKEE